MAAIVMSSALSLKKPSFPLADSRPAIKGLPSLARRSGAFKVEAKGKKITVAQPYGPGGGLVYKEGVDASGRKAKGKKIKVALPYGPSGGLVYKEGVDASGRKAKGKGLYQFADKYGANVDGYSPIYSPEEWSPSGDTYVGGQTGLLIWAVTLAALLAGGALLVYSTSALSQ